MSLPKELKDQKIALEIWGDQGNPLHFIIESNTTIGFTRNSCERCGKKFRFYRREYHVYDRKANPFNKWKRVCIDCIDLENDAY